MRIGRTMGRCAAAIAVGLLAMTAQVAPAGADPGYVQLNINAMSPQYSVNGCRYKIQYGNFGTAPFAGVRFYGGCSNLNVSVRSSDSNGVHWTASSTVALTGTDSCGAYSLVQATGPNPGYGTGASVLATGTTGGFWKAYDFDGDQTQPIHSLC